MIIIRAIRVLHWKISNRVINYSFKLLFTSVSVTATNKRNPTEGKINTDQCLILTRYLCSWIKQRCVRYDHDFGKARVNFVIRMSACKLWYPIFGTLFQNMVLYIVEFSRLVFFEKGLKMQS